MEPRVLEEINAFLTARNKASLFEYYGISPEAPDEEVDEALKKRRAWAQGQQANPKFKQEALWVIQKDKLVRRVLLEERAAYVAQLVDQDRQKRTDGLRLFIKGTLAQGVLTARGEEAILAHGQQLGLDISDVRRALDAQMRESGVGRDTAGSTPDFNESIDYYAVLQASPTSSVLELEAAYRERYQAARMLQDGRAANDQYALLDQAWELLRDTAARARYDVHHREAFGHQPTPAPAPLPEPPKKPLSIAPEPLEERSQGGGLQLKLNPGPLPPTLQNRSTLPSGSAGQPVRPERPVRLTIEGPDSIRLSVGRSPVSAAIKVRKNGVGRMPGQVRTDRDWVEVSPSRLDAEAVEQLITIKVDPSRLDRASAVAVVTVLTDDGDRRAVNVEVERRSGQGMWMGLLAAVLLTGLAAVGWKVVGSGQTAAPAGPPPPRLQVQVDPPAGEIFINGKLVSSEGQAEISDGLSADQPVALHVTLTGFKDWTQEIKLEAGQVQKVQPVLELSDPMSFLPVADQVRGEVDPTKVKAGLARLESRLQSCLKDHVRGEAGATASVDVVVYVSALGQVNGLAVEQASFESSSAIACVRRYMRALSLPIIRGDYGMFRHSIRATLGPGSKP